MKNYLLVFALLSLLSACNPYSDEMVYYYEDESATIETNAAPTKSVSSEDLITPPMLSENATTQEIIQETTIQENIVEMPLDKQNKTDAPQAQDLIPMTYGDNVQPNFTKKTIPAFNGSDISPKVYAIVASRTVNKMLDETQNLYQSKDAKKKLFIPKAQKLNSSLPDGFNYANKTIYDIVDGSSMFILVSKVDDADLVLESSFDAKANPNMPSPIIVFNLTLKDNAGKVIDSWQENIKQLANDDQSWW